MRISFALRPRYILCLTVQSLFTSPIHIAVLPHGLVSAECECESDEPLANQLVDMLNMCCHIPIALGVLLGVRRHEAE